MFRIRSTWLLGIVLVALLGAHSTDAYLCMCSPMSCVLIHPNTDFFNNAENFCSSFRTAAHDISIIKLMDTKLSPEAFNKFPNMTTLEIFQGQLEKIDSETFSAAGNLQKLLIRGNSLTKLNDHTFKGADKLRDLMISSNPLSSIEENAFANLRQLEMLILAHGELTSLPKKVFQHNRMLKIISLNGNKLESIDSEVFVGLDDLTKLELPENNLKVFDFKSLKASVIVMNNNSLTDLTINEHCNTMYASNNEIQTITVLGNNLSKLSVINNKIRNINNITKAKNLTSLSLGSNPLDPNTSFSSLTSLEELMLQSTFLNLTENTFADMKQLKILDLSYNNLTEANFRILGSVSSLQVLSYVGNQIASFNYIEAREYLPRLRVLEICKNGWNNTYFETNILRMRRFQLSPDVHGFSSHFLFRDDYIRMCSEKLIDDYNYEDYVEQPIDVEDEIRASYPKELTTTSTSTTTTTTTTTPAPTTTTKVATTTTERPATAKATGERATEKTMHHVLEHNTDIGQRKVTAIEPTKAASPWFITFQVLVYVLSVVGLGTLVFVAYRWRRRQLGARPLAVSTETADSVRLI